MISFFVEGMPKGQPRTKSSPHHHYTPDVAEGWRQRVWAAAQPHKPATPHRGPVEIELHFWFLRPASHLKKDGTLRKAAPRRFVSTPDFDNAIKSLTDELEGIFYVNDRQIDHAQISMAYGDRAGCEVVIWLDADGFYPPIRRLVKSMDKETKR